MKVNKQILRVIILFIMIVTIYNIKSYCSVDGTWRMEIKKIEQEQAGIAPWTNINVSNAYKECESLNSTTSTLGTNNLKAHLTTDADWSAMAIFSISQYGGATNNSPTTTTGNESGVYKVGNKYTFTTGILNTATKTTNQYISGLFNEDGSLKPYMKQWALTRTDNDFVAFKDKENGGTYGWFNNIWKSWSNYTDYPIMVKQGLFGIGFAHWTFQYGIEGGTGKPQSYYTFRPVIWN